MSDTRSVVGGSRPHESAVAHVTGTAQYIDDLPIPGNALHVATGYSLVACGALTGLGLSDVRSTPGVIDVVTAADIPGANEVGAIFPGDPLLADGEVRYAAQPIFAVAAETHRAAVQAARRAQIQIDPQQPLLDVNEAHAQQAYVRPSRVWQRGDLENSHGDRVTSKLHVRGQEHFYLEGQVALAIPEDHDELRIYSSTQHPDEVQHLVAQVLDMPLHRVRVTCRRMGGAFGGKESQAASLACLAALLARRTGRAVKYRMPRSDDMLQTGKRHDFKLSYQLDCDAAGMLQRADVELLGMCGHSPDLSDGIVDRAMFHATNAYYVPNVRIAGHRCMTNTVSNTAFRGFGGPQGMLGMEAAMDELAHAQGIDPLELRKRNLYASGRDVTPYGQQVEEFELLPMIERLEVVSDYRSRQAAAARFNEGSHLFKKGLALTPVQFGISFTAIHLNQAGALVHLFRDGSIEVNHAGTEMGQGLHTKIQQVAAEALGLTPDRVRVSATQTDKVPNGSPTAASSGSDLNGMAVLDACTILKQRLTQTLETALGWPTDVEVVWQDNRVVAGDRDISFAELVTAAYLQRTSLSATGFYQTPDLHWDPDAGTGRPFYYFAHGAAASEVEIDTRTGAYRVLRTDIVHDAGSSLNPSIDLGQIEGGFAQGLGWLTTEELLWDDQGRLASNGPANYKIPAASDGPETLNVWFHERPNPQPTVYRSKAVGEPPLMLPISVWCALRSACAAAGSGRTLPPLGAPATPEAVYRAVRAAKGTAL